jgi:flagellar biosynthesis/type III secretory pathway chaperone
VIASPDKLLDILRQEKEIFRKLVDLSNIEQAHIINNNIEGLLEVTNKKERLAVAIQDLEHKRQAFIINSGSNQLNGPFKTHLSADGIEPIFENEADELRDELISVLAEFDNINQTNSELLKRSLDYVGFMLSAIMPDENPMYSNDKASVKVNPCLFDGKA